MPLCLKSGRAGTKTTSSHAGLVSPKIRSWGCFVGCIFMSRSIWRVTFTVLLLPLGLAAQRYTGHDHAVFHRAPQPPPPTAKHQSQPTTNATKTSPKTSQASIAGQSASHGTTSQNRQELDLNQNSAQTPTENPPRF